LVKQAGPNPQARFELKRALTKKGFLGRKWTRHGEKGESGQWQYGGRKFKLSGEVVNGPEASFGGFARWDIIQAQRERMWNSESTPRSIEGEGEEWS